MRFSQVHGHCHCHCDWHGQECRHLVAYCISRTVSWLFLKRFVVTVTVTGHGVFILATSSRIFLKKMAISHVPSHCESGHHELVMNTAIESPFMNLFIILNWRKSVFWHSKSLAIMSSSIGRGSWDRQTCRSIQMQWKYFQVCCWACAVLSTPDGLN